MLNLGSGKPMMFQISQKGTQSKTTKTGSTIVEFLSSIPKYTKSTFEVTWEETFLRRAAEKLRNNRPKTNCARKKTAQTNSKQV